MFRTLTSFCGFDPDTPVKRHDNWRGTKQARDYIRDLLDKVSLAGFEARAVLEKSKTDSAERSSSEDVKHSSHLLDFVRFVGALVPVVSMKSK